ncbi:hypothetical protein ACFL6L_04100 [candidate division KSB1 bacterium]
MLKKTASVLLAVSLLVTSIVAFADEWEYCEVTCYCTGGWPWHSCYAYYGYQADGDGDGDGYGEVGCFGSAYGCWIEVLCYGYGELPGGGWGYVEYEGSTNCCAFSETADYCDYFGAGGGNNK